MILVDIVNWMRDPANEVNDVTEISCLEAFRETIADRFQLKSTHPDIQKAFEKFVSLKRPFHETQHQAIVDKDELDAKWVKRTERYSWSLLRNFLEEMRNWNDESLSLLDDSSEEILRRFAEPGTTKKRLGLVIGYVQSGKTASMAATMAKAADEGYKIFIILAGTLNNLRQQTQIRFIQELVGTKDGQLGGRPTIVRDPQTIVPLWQALTNADPNDDRIGDIEAGGENDISFEPGHGPVIAVIKKNKSRITKLISKLRKINSDFVNQPCLILDDESDAASINTAKDKEKVNATNGAIRTLVQTFKNVTYVGYTATPYANLFIDYQNPTGATKFGSDLFPEDFISLLQKPPGYFGTSDLFGAPKDVELDEVENELPIFSEFVKNEDFDITEIEKAESIDDVPTLHLAVDCFILSCAARIVRGQGKSDMSMLINPGVLVDQHNKLKKLVLQYLLEIKAGVESADKVVFAGFRSLWDREFLNHPDRSLKAIRRELQRRNDQSRDPGYKYDLAGYRDHEFSTIQGEIQKVFRQLEIKVINSKADSKLEYGNPEKPKRYIVIGGNKLSRGLTLEGLSVSYFIRNPEAPCYDSLMQMGRWFGYRNGFIDLCRIWAAPEVIFSFSQIAMADEDLRAQIREDYRNLKPREIPPMVFRFDGLQITSGDKMGAAIRLSRSGARIDQTKPKFEKEAVGENNAKWMNFFSILGRSSSVANSNGLFIFEKRLKSDQLLSELRAIDTYNLDLTSLKNLVDRGDQTIDWMVCVAGLEGSGRKKELSINGNSISISLAKRGVKKFLSPAVPGFRVISDPKHLKKLAGLFGEGTMEGMGFLVLYMVDGARLKEGIEDSIELDKVKDVPSDIDFMMIPTLKMPALGNISGGNYFGQPIPSAEYLEDDLDD